MLRSDPLIYLRCFVATVSIVTAFGAVMVMQVVGQRWTTSATSRTLQWLQRFGLATLSVALFTSGVVIPFDYPCDPAILVLVGAVSSAIAVIVLPTALMGCAEHDHVHHF